MGCAFYWAHNDGIGGHVWLSDGDLRALTDEMLVQGMPWPVERIEEAAPIGAILRRPGVPTAMVGAVASFAVMVGVMNLSGFVAVDRGHQHGDVFTIISAHIVGMYGLVIVVGDLVDRIGRRRSLVGG